MSARTRSAMAEALAGRRRGLRATLPFAGPAVVASVAYMDPGNFATNIQAGAKYGYSLLWVVVLANLVAMLFQGMSAKLGIVTGRNLAELCRDHFPRARIPMWVASELAAMATDLAEFLGGAIGISLLLGVPLLWGMGITAAASYGILALDRYGFRPIEIAVAALVGVIGASYLLELVIAPPDWGAAARGALVPQLADAGALTLAVGIIGATVMPHALFLHSGLVQDRLVVRTEEQRAKLLRWSNREVVVALGLAGLVNMAMVAMAARAFHAGHPGVAEIEEAYHTLVPVLGGAAAAIFLTSLIASGLSSSAVGTLAGQVVMQGFLHVTIPVWVRRLVTMLPSFAVVAAGVNPTQALVVSQVVLSLALPVPMVALVLLARRADVLGRFRNRGLTQAGAVLAAAGVLLLNALLVLQASGVELPFLPAG